MTHQSEPASSADDLAAVNVQARHRTVKVWTPNWYERPDDTPTVACGAAYHYADVWFQDCEHTPQVWDYTESARALCDETGADGDILEAIAKVYYTSWALHRRQGVDHVSQWP